MNSNWLALLVHLFALLNLAESASTISRSNRVLDAAVRAVSDQAHCHFVCLHQSRDLFIGRSGAHIFGSRQACSLVLAHLARHCKCSFEKRHEARVVASSCLSTVGRTGAVVLQGLTSCPESELQNLIFYR